MTTEERMKILKMIDKGKITAEEGARLLSTLNESRKPARKVTLQGATGGSRWLKIRVTDMITGGVSGGGTVVLVDEVDPTDGAQHLSGA